MTVEPDNVVAFPSSLRTGEALTGEMIERRERFRPIVATLFGERPAPEWLVKNVLPKAGLAVVYGASGSGKSFFVLDLLAAVAMGNPWRERKTKRSKVIYIAAEGAGGFAKRIKAYEQQRAVLGGRLMVVPAAPNFLSDEEIGDLIAAVIDEQPEVIVADTLAQVTAGGDENSAVDMGKAIGQCRRLHEATGALVVLIHHAGKDASRGARGWSGIRAACDVEIVVEGNATTGHVARVSKQKDGEDGLEFGFRLAPVPVGMDDDGDVITSCVVEECDPPTSLPPAPVLGANQRIVLEALRELEAGSGDPVAEGALIARAVELMPAPEKGERDQRRTRARSAIRVLADRQLIFGSATGWLPADAGSDDLKNQGSNDDA